MKLTLIILLLVWQTLARPRIQDNNVQCDNSISQSTLVRQAIQAEQAKGDLAERLIFYGVTCINRERCVNQTGYGNFTAVRTASEEYQLIRDSYPCIDFDQLTFTSTLRKELMFNLTNLVEQYLEIPNLTTFDEMVRNYTQDNGIMKSRIAKYALWKSSLEPHLYQQLLQAPTNIVMWLFQFAYTQRLWSWDKFSAASYLFISDNSAKWQLFTLTPESNKNGLPLGEIFDVMEFFRRIHNQ